MLSAVITSYLYQNTIPVLVIDDNASPNLRYRAVYSRTLKLYKGTNNVVRFAIQNQEQKKYDLRTSVEIASATIAPGGAGSGYAVSVVNENRTANIINASWVTGVATFTTETNHSIPNGATVVVSAIDPVGFNGTLVATVTGSSSFTAPLADPTAAYTAGGTVTYTVTASNEVTVSGGTAVTPAKITIDAVSTTGAITALTVTDAGVYSYPPITTNNFLSGGSGTRGAVNLVLNTLSTAQVQLNIFDDNNTAVLLTKTATVIDAAAGIVQVELGASDLSIFESQNLSYSLGLVDSESSEISVLYTDSNWGARGQAILVDGHFPAHLPSTEIFFPAADSSAIEEPYASVLNNTFISNSVFMDAAFKRNNSLHTFQFFFDPLLPFNGDVVVEASTDPMATFNNSPNSVNWTTVDTTTLASQTESYYLNLEGVYTAVRVKVIPTSGTLQKILYRS
jgi:hypothetical protein